MGKGSWLYSQLTPQWRMPWRLKNQTYEWTIDILNTALEFLILYSVMVCWSVNMYYTGNAGYYGWQCATMVTVPFLYLFVRKMFRPGLIYYMLHTVTAVIVMTFYPFDTNSLAILSVFSFAAIAISLRHTFTKRKDAHRLIHPEFGVVILVAGIIIEFNSDHIRDSQQWAYKHASTAVLVAGFLFILLYLLNMYFVNFHKFFHNNASVHTVSIDKMKQSNHYILLLFTPVCALFMFLAAVLPLSAMFTAVLKWLLRLLIMIVSPFWTGLAELLEQMMTTLDGGGALPSSDDNKEKEGASPFGQFQKIMIYAVMIIGTVVLLAAVVYVIYHALTSRVVSYQEDTDVAEYIPYVEQDEQEIKKEKIKEPEYGSSNNERVRRVFYRTVRKRQQMSRDASLPDAMSKSTSRELDNRLPAAPENRKELRQLTEYYQQARYGRDQVTDQTVDQAEKIERRIRVIKKEEKK